MSKEKDGYNSPYIPNNDAEIREEMLQEIGVKDVEELYADIPESSRFRGKLNIPPSMSESEVKKHVSSILSKNRSNEEVISFLGAGCWPHYVPALCDEVKGRSEFLTAYAGETYSDLGKFQALFEFQSMMGELLNLDAVGLSVYDWATACGDAARMAAKVTGDSEILVPRLINPERLSVMRNYCESLAEVNLVDYSPETGLLDLEDLKEKISADTAGVYIENPSYLGFIEENGKEISEIAHDYDALSIVGVDPISLGVLSPPGDYGADIVCGEGQPLGMHMNYGGGLVGILACRDEERIVSAMPCQLLTIAPEAEGDNFGFSWWALPERSMYFERAKVKSIVGSSTALWSIAAGVYLALVGSDLDKLGETIMQKSHYAKQLISQIDGVSVPVFESSYFKEFTVNFDNTDKSVKEVNQELLDEGIQGGKDLSEEFPELGETALYCVTEIHDQEEIEKLARTLEGVL